MCVLVFFDFDGTITTKDSLMDFIEYAVGKTSYYWGIIVLSPVLLCYKMKLIQNYRAKQKLMAYFFKGWNEERFRLVADQYSCKKINAITKSEAMGKLQFHKQQGHTVVVVSASMEEWLKKWCEKQSVELIATRLEYCNGRVTGKFASRNCYGMEKVYRIKEKYNIEHFKAIYAYGDSPGDKEMLGIATRKFYRCFD